MLRKRLFYLYKYSKNKQKLYGLFFYFLNKNKFEKIELPITLFNNTFIRNKNKIKFGKNITIYHNCFISPIELTVGDNCDLGVNNFICGKVKIGNNVSIGPNVNIPGANHNIKTTESIKTSGNEMKGTIIKDEVWIGGNSSILDGVTIEKGAVIGAGSVVTKDIPEYAIAVGAPAKVVGFRQKTTAAETLGLKNK
ncbi:MAG: acyltransferase [Patescibacteria group bacterium]